MRSRSQNRGIHSLVAGNGLQHVEEHQNHTAQEHDAAHQTDGPERVGGLHRFNEAVGQGPVRIHGAPHQTLHHTGNPQGSDVQHHTDGGDPEVGRHQLGAIHFLLAKQPGDHVVDGADGHHGHPTQSAGVHVADRPVSVVGQGIHGLHGHHGAFEGGHTVEGQGGDEELQDGIIPQFVPGAGQGHDAVDHAAPGGSQQNQGENHTHGLGPVRQSGVVQMVRTRPHVGEDQRPEVHHGQTVGIHRTARLLRHKVVHHAQEAGGQEEAHRVVAVPPLHHGILHTRIGGVGLGQGNGDFSTIHHVQQSYSDDEGTVEPVGHINVADLTDGDGTEEDHGVGNPHHGDQDINRPFQFGVFLGRGETHGQGKSRQQNHQLPTPEGEGG